jgi:hypothetical protein
LNYAITLIQLTWIIYVRAYKQDSIPWLTPKVYRVSSAKKKNSVLARQNPSVIDNLLQTELEKGYVKGPFPLPPFPTYRVSPLGIATHKYSGKKRLIFDLSSPHNNPQPSVNDLIDKDLCTLSYIRFVVLRGLQFTASELPPVSEQLLIYFVAHCDQYLHLAYTTIKLYLSGIRYFYLRIKGFNPLESSSGYTSTCLHTVLTGLKKKQSLCHVSKRTRLPITMSILHRICVLLQSGVFDHFTSSMLEAACTVAFLGFLRCSEFTVLQDKNYLDFCALTMLFVRKVM